jgi:hypothetical protein
MCAEINHLEKRCKHKHAAPVHPRSGVLRE